MAITKWRLLRTKLDETTDDPNWVGTHVVPDRSICATFEQFPSRGALPPYTGIEVVIGGVTATREPVQRGADTVVLTLIEAIPRDSPTTGGTPGDVPFVIDSEVREDVRLFRKEYFPIGGSTQFTIRITGDATFDGLVDRAELWWRPVTR